MKHGHYILTDKNKGELTIGFFGAAKKVRDDYSDNFTTWHIIGDGNYYSTKELRVHFDIHEFIEVKLTPEKVNP